jgi:uncharacterized protein YjlB
MQETGMAVVEEFKRLAEKAVGVGRPTTEEAMALVRPVKPRLLTFENDGQTPNNARRPLVLYRTAIGFRRHLDPAAIIEQVFAHNGWDDGWRNGIYDFLHFHAGTHEVLGIARGQTRVQFGGVKGKTVTLKAGDVVIVPAGVGHQRVGPAQDLLVVGAYPTEGDFDEFRPEDIDLRAAIARIAKVPTPQRHPLYGEEEPLGALWP